MVSEKWRSAHAFAVRAWLVEFGPLLWVLISLWARQIYFGVYLQSIWLQESLDRWIRSHAEMFGATLAVLLLLVAPTLILSRIPRYFLLVIINLALTSVIVADRISIRFYGDVISLANLTSWPMMNAAVWSVLHTVRLSDSLYYLDIVVALLIFPLYARFCRRVEPVDQMIRRRVSLVMPTTGLMLAIPALQLIWQNQNGASAYSNLQREICAAIGVVPYHLLDGVTRHSLPHFKVSDSARERIRNYLARQRQQSARSPLAGIARGKNLILINAESLQAFPIGMELDGQLIAPRLTAFARESLWFENFYDQTHLGTTADGEFIALNSLYPTPLGQAAMLFQKNDFRALPRLLSENGYATISACGAPATFWKMNENHAHFGFQRSWFEDSYHITERIGPWMADREFFSQTVERLKEQSPPFMLFMLSSSNHHPYPLPEKYRTVKTGELAETIAGDYLQTVHYFDSAFGVLLDRLRESGLLDQTVIALYGDHQGFLGEPPQLARALGFAEESEYHFFQFRKRLAFLIRLPRGQKAEVIKTPGGHLDIAPTLLSLLGIERNQSVMLGRDLTEGGESLVVFRDGSFADNRHFFINRFGPASLCSCYDSGSGWKIDCGELRDKQQQALERLAVSDQILRGNLLPQLIRERNDRNKRE